MNDNLPEVQVRFPSEEARIRPDSKPSPVKRKLTDKEIHRLAIRQAARKIQAQRKAEAEKKS